MYYGWITFIYQKIEVQMDRVWLKLLEIFPDA